MASQCHEIGWQRLQDSGPQSTDPAQVSVEDLGTLAGPVTVERGQRDFSVDDLPFHDPSKVGPRRSVSPLTMVEPTEKLQEWWFRLPTCATMGAANVGWYLHAPRSRAQPGEGE